MTNTKLTPCLNATAFANTAATGFVYTQYPNQTRNQYRGPNYVDFDMALFKTFDLGERFKFGLGAQAFDVFNHPNFTLPDAELAARNSGRSWACRGCRQARTGIS